MMPNLGNFGSVVEEKPCFDAWLFHFTVGVDESRARLGKESTIILRMAPEIPEVENDTLPQKSSAFFRPLLCVG